MMPNRHLFASDINSMLHHLLGFRPCLFMPYFGDYFFLNGFLKHQIRTNIIGITFYQNKNISYLKMFISAQISFSCRNKNLSEDVFTCQITVISPQE